MWSPLLRRVWAPALTLVVIFAAAVLLKPSGQMEEAMRGRTTIGDTAARIVDDPGRLGMWRNALGLTNPILGCGYGSAPIVQTIRLTPNKAKALDWFVHNDYLEAYLDLGIPGLLLFSAPFALLILLAWRGRGDPLAIAAGAAAVGFAALMVTNFMAERVDNQVWFAGVAALLNSRPFVRPVVQRQVGRNVPRALNALGGLGLLGLAGVVAVTIRGDAKFRSMQNLVESWTQLPRERAASLRPWVSQDVGLLADDVLPTMRFSPKMRHLYCRWFTGYAMAVGNLAAAEAFAREALRLHPADAQCMNVVARRALETGREAEGVAMLEREVKTLGADPDSNAQRILARIYRARGQSEKALALERQMAANAVTLPADPVPANRAPGVPVDVVFDWGDCGAARTYELYLWKTGEQTPAVPVGRGLKTSQFRPTRPLDPDTVYFWRVKAIGLDKEQTGEIWFFRTAAQ